MCTLHAKENRKVDHFSLSVTFLCLHFFCHSFSLLQWVNYLLPFKSAFLLTAKWRNSAFLTWFYWELLLCLHQINHNAVCPYNTAKSYGKLDWPFGGFGEFLFWGFDFRFILQHFVGFCVWVGIEMPTFFSFLNLYSNLVMHVKLVLARNIRRKNDFPGCLSSKATDLSIQLDQSLSKWLPWTNTISISWKQVRDAKSQAPPTSCWVRNSGVGALKFVPSALKFENYREQIIVLLEYFFIPELLSTALWKWNHKEYLLGERKKLYIGPLRHSYN